MSIKLYNIESKKGAFLSTAEYEKNKFHSVTLAPQVLIDVSTIYSVEVDVEHYELLLADLKKCNEYVVYRILKRDGCDYAVIHTYTDCIESYDLKVYYRQILSAKTYHSGLTCIVKSKESEFFSQHHNVTIEEIQSLITVANKFSVLLCLMKCVLGNSLMNPKGEILRNLTHAVLNTGGKITAFLIKMDFEKQVNINVILKPIIILAANIGIDIRAVHIENKPEYLKVNLH